MMVYRILLFTLCIAFISSCNSKEEVYTGTDIPRDTLVVILKEMQIADALQAHYALNQSGKNVDQGMVYISILKKHNTDRESFEKTMNYYTRNLEVFDEIYKEVAASLELDESSTSKSDTLNVQP